MTGVAIAPLAAQNPDRAIALSATLALIVAEWALLARLLRAGIIAQLLSTPLLVGYLAGGAVLMVVGQLGRVTGTSFEGDDRRGSAWFPRRRHRHRLADARGRREHAGSHPAAALAGPVAARPLIAVVWPPWHRSCSTSSHTGWRWWARSLRGCPCRTYPR